MNPYIASLGTLIAAAPVLAAPVPVTIATTTNTLSLVDAASFIEPVTGEVPQIVIDGSMFGSVAIPSTDDALVIAEVENFTGPASFLLPQSPSFGLTPPPGSVPPVSLVPTNSDKGDGGQSVVVPLPTAGFMAFAGLAGLSMTRRRRD